MSSKKRKQKRDLSAKSDPATASAEVRAASADVNPTIATAAPWSTWPAWKRRVASTLILAYLFVLIMGPLSNPIASPHLTTPIAAQMAPLHRGLFLGHGYRFFAPNPGDSHLVQYKITKSDGTQVQGVFPDRDAAWPRLLYHRWFMLSETIFAEHAQTPSANEFNKLNNEKRARTKLLTQNARLKLANELEKQRSQEEAKYTKTMLRIKALVRATAQFLLERHGGDEIELTVATRTIPFPVEVRQGAQLDDEVFLRYPTNSVIGRFKKSDFSKSSPDVKSDDMESAK